HSAVLPLPTLVHFWVSRVSSNRREPFAALAPRLPKPESVNKAGPDALFSGGFRLQHGRARFRDFFVLGRAFRAAYANRANHLAVVNDRHATPQPCKVRQRRHRRTALVDGVFKILRGLLEDRRRARLADGDIFHGLWCRREGPTLSVPGQLIFARSITDLPSRLSIGCF